MFRKRTFAELAAETKLRQGRLPLVLVLHNIRSQYNVGAILRTADAVGVEKIIFSGYTPTPSQKGVQKTALKALAHVAWEYSENVQQSIQELKQQDYHVYALEQCHESVEFTRVAYQFPLVIILGEEVEGVSNELLPLVDTSVEIPMFGRAHSLNVSVAAGILFYECLRQFRQ